MADDALAEVSDELYALPPDEFTAARNARAKQLRLDDRALANAVSELRRPSPAAWLVNQLVRHRADELEELLQLGEQLRAAQADLDTASLTALARERRKVVGALARDAGRLADELGNPVRGTVLDEVAETLQAGMTDASAAVAVRTGRLVRGLEAIGTEVDLDGAVAGGTAAGGGPLDAGGLSGRAARTRDAAPDTHDEVGARRARKRREEQESDREREARERAERERDRVERERAERRADEAESRAVTAEQTAAEASSRLDDAHAATDRAAATRDDLEAQLRDLEARLAHAERDLADAERAARPLEREHDRAARAAEEARAAADELRAELD